MSINGIRFLLSHCWFPFGFFFRLRFFFFFLKKKATPVDREFTLTFTVACFSLVESCRTLSVNRIVLNSEIVRTSAARVFLVPLCFPFICVYVALHPGFIFRQTQVFFFLSGAYRLLQGFLVRSASSTTQGCPVSTRPISRSVGLLLCAWFCCPP